MGIRDGNDRLTFLHMRAATYETAGTRVRRHATGVMQRLGPAKSTSASARVLVCKMGVLRATALSKVFDLHDLREYRNVHGRFRSFRVIVFFQDLRILQTQVYGKPSRQCSIRGKRQLT